MKVQLCEPDPDSVSMFGSAEHSICPHGDCIGCSCDGGVGNILMSSAEAVDECDSWVRLPNSSKAVSSGMPAGLLEPGGVGAEH